MSWHKALEYGQVVLASNPSSLTHFVTSRKSTSLASRFLWRDVRLSEEWLSREKC